MKKSLVIMLFALICLKLSAQHDSVFLSTVITGYFDADKTRDTAKLWVPMKKFEMWGCQVCNTYITFSNRMTDIFHESDVGGRLENAGDLNGDGIDEIVYCSDWFQGCWGTLELYQAKDDDWQRLAAVAFYACGDTNSLRSRIKILPDHKISITGDNADDDQPALTIIEIK